MTYKVKSWHVCGSELGRNTCLCEILYIVSGFPQFSIGPSAFFKCSFRDEMKMSQISFVVMRNSISMFSFPGSHIVFLQKYMLL